MAGFRNVFDIPDAVNSAVIVDRISGTPSSKIDIDYTAKLFTTKSDFGIAAESDDVVIYFPSLVGSAGVILEMVSPSGTFIDPSSGFSGLYLYSRTDDPIDQDQFVFYGRVHLGANMFYTPNPSAEVVRIFNDATAPFGLRLVKNNNGSGPCGVSCRLMLDYVDPEPPAAGHFWKNLRKALEVT